MSAQAVKIDNAVDFETERFQAIDDRNDVASIWAEQLMTQLDDARTLLVCGSGVNEFADQLGDRLRIQKQPMNERPIPFVDREAGRDTRDEIGGVFCICDTPPAAAHTIEMAKNLRAVLDRSFHDAPVILGVVDAGGATILLETDLPPPN